MQGSRIADGTAVARYYFVGSDKPRNSHLDILPSVDRQNAELVTQFPIGYGGLQQEVFLG